MFLLELLKTILLGIVEGITEWLPISSTGHLILLNNFIKLDVSEEFWDMFEVVIQLGAILAVVVLYFHQLNPFSPKKDRNQKIDTIWNTVDFDFFPDSTNSLNYFIRRPWKYGEEYRIEVDSAAIHSLYGKWNDFFTGEFKIKKEDEYGHLYLNINGVDTTAFVELLSSGDAPVRKAKVKDGGVLFMDLKPDKYYARIVIDTNDNGVWDTGNYAEKRQPEEVYYSPKMYEIMQNWQVEETWNVNSTPLAKQKPLEITKNKPKEATKKKRNYKDESQQSSSRNNSSGNMGMPF